MERGDRIILCSDGLSSMVPDAKIELLSVSSATPIDCTDQLVAAALEAGGHDNVSVIVVDVVSDGREEARRLARRRAVLGWLAVLLGLTVVLSIALGFFIRSSWYIGVGGGRVGIYQGIHSSVFGIPLSSLEESTQVSIVDLPESTQHQLSAGIPVASKDDALTAVQAYQTQIEEARAKAQKAADDAQSDSTDGAVGSALGASGPEAAETGADVVTTSAEGGAA